ncbi:hypothetical protein AGMMS49940_13340 [Spirochaetia bacterium]|nr:hypothetical protein AGMMS49940_13340 [Spirochaetia bacterium]
MTTIQEGKEDPVTFEKFWEMFQESSREFDLQMKESSREFDLRMKESSREFDLRMKETRQLQEETALQMKETDRRISEVSKQIGGMTKSDGDLAEEHFFTSLASKMTFAGQHYHAIDRNVKRKVGDLEGEYDIVLYNDASVVIFEVKSKAKTEHLEKLVTKKLPDFRTLFPLYRDYDIYLGIGSMSFDEQVVERAHELGIGVLRQKGDTIEADTGPVRAY